MQHHHPMRPHRGCGNKIISAASSGLSEEHDAEGNKCLDGLERLLNKRKHNAMRYRRRHGGHHGATPGLAAARKKRNWQ